MDIIMGGRAWGKTHAAVGWVKEQTNRVLLVHNENERRRIISQYGLGPEKVATWDHLRSNRRANLHQYAIDNIDLFLRAMLHEPIDLFTAPAGRIVMAGADAANSGYARPGFVSASSARMDPAFVPEPMQRTVRAAGEPMVDPSSRWFPPFTEDTLEDAIFLTWGEHGAHADVWREVRRRAIHDTILFQQNVTPQRLREMEARASRHESEIIREALRNGTVEPREKVLADKEEIRKRGIESNNLREQVRRRDAEITELASKIGDLRQTNARLVGDVLSTPEYQQILAQLNEERQARSHVENKLNGSINAHNQLRQYTDAKLREITSLERQADVEVAARREAHRRIEELEGTLFRIRGEVEQADNGG